MSEGVSIFPQTWSGPIPFLPVLFPPFPFLVFPFPSFFLLSRNPARGRGELCPRPQWGAHSAQKWSGLHPRSATPLNVSSWEIGLGSWSRLDLDWVLTHDLIHSELMWSLIGLHIIWYGKWPTEKLWGWSQKLVELFSWCSMLIVHLSD